MGKDDRLGGKGRGGGEGVVGGAPGGAGAASIVAPEPIPARPSDLASVRERIATTLVYPQLARRMKWQGRVVVGFVLLADGAVRLLRVVQTCGFPELDGAALSAVQRGAPYQPPGVDVRIEIPVVFRL